MLFLIVFFFFKQKTAYEMRISDWSSDVCSSDLLSRFRADVLHALVTGHLPGDRAEVVAKLGVELAGSVAMHQVFERIEDRPFDRLHLRVVGIHQWQFLLEHQHARRNRSEEHTSELQSLMRISSAVFCLKK